MSVGAIFGFLLDPSYTTITLASHEQPSHYMNHEFTQKQLLIIPSTGTWEEVVA